MFEIQFPATRLHGYRSFVRLRDPGAELRMALLLLGATLLLGRYGPAMPGIWIPARMLGLPYIPMAALSFVSGVGAASYALARASTMPAAAADTVLPAMLVALILLPGLGALALLPPIAISLLGEDPFNRRLVPLLASAMALAYLGEHYLPIALAGSVAALGATVSCWRKAARIAANDNPCVERILTLSERTLPMCYDKGAKGDSESGELRDVQG